MAKGSQRPDVMEVCKMTVAATMDKALALAPDELGLALEAFVMLRALLTLLVVSGTVDG